MNPSEAKYAQKEIKRLLLGGTITSLAIDSNDDSYYGLVIKKGRKQFVAWVLRDPEGNGPGFVSIEEKK